MRGSAFHSTQMYGHSGRLGGAYPDADEDLGI
jgi:hypothetical protein